MSISDIERKLYFFPNSIECKARVVDDQDIESAELKAKMRKNVLALKSHINRHFEDST